MSEYHLAQFNRATLLYPSDHPSMFRFGLGARQVTRLAAEAAGHIWSEQDIIDEKAFATRSLWSSPAALEAFVYSGTHHAYMKQSNRWFAKAEGPNFVLWWVPPNARPSLEEAEDRLNLLIAAGPTEEAFDLAWLRRQN